MTNEHAFSRDRIEALASEIDILKESVSSIFSGIYQSGIAERYAHKMICYYERFSENKLSSLCDLYGSDKGSASNSAKPYPWPAHTYTDLYHSLFCAVRHDFKNVFELGIGTNNPFLASNMGPNGKPGASLRVWRDYFENAMVFGADIDPDILFQEDRINTYCCNQLDPDSIKRLWEEVPGVEFDLIIDDGLHTFEAAISFFENSFWKLRPGGTYIIEDVAFHQLSSYARYFCSEKLDHEIICLYKDHHRLGGNSVIKICSP